VTSNSENLVKLPEQEMDIAVIRARCRPEVHGTPCRLLCTDVFLIIKTQAQA
jgi:hypothetical protein